MGAVDEVCCARAILMNCQWCGQPSIPGGLGMCGACALEAANGHPRLLPEKKGRNKMRHDSFYGYTIAVLVVLVFVAAMFLNQSL
jgi:hypothetical protein